MRDTRRVPRGRRSPLAVTLQSQSLTQYLASRDKVSGSVYLIVLVLFALMPRLRLRSRE
jgi:hypothetical protein